MGQKQQKPWSTRFAHHARKDERAFLEWVESLGGFEGRRVPDGVQVRHVGVPGAYTVHLTNSEYRSLLNAEGWFKRKVREAHDAGRRASADVPPRQR